MPKQERKSVPPEPIEAKRYPCTQCGLDYKIAKDLRMHLLNIHGIKTLVCEACAEPFYKESDLAEHMAVVHRGHNRHYCPVCGKSYKSYKTLLMHSAQRHKVEESVFCDKCGQEFHNNLALRSHLQLQHKSHQVYRKCDKCPRSFRLLGYLKLHKEFDHGLHGKKKALEYLKTLTLKKNLTDDAVHCKPCNIKFKFTVDLIRHLQLEHAKVKKFTCCQCSGAIYHSRASLAGHMRHDHGIINHSCPKCPPVQRYYKNVPLKVKKIKKMPLSKEHKKVSRSRKESMLSWFMNQNAPNLIQKEPQVIKAPWLARYVKENIPSDLELEHVTELELNNLRHNIKTAFNILSTIAPSKLKAAVIPEITSKGTTKNVLGKNVDLLSIMFPNFNPASISAANSCDDVHIVRRPSPLKASDRPNITDSNDLINAVNIENNHNKTTEDDNAENIVIADTVSESTNTAMDVKKSLKRKKDNKEDASHCAISKLQKNEAHKEIQISKPNPSKKINVEPSEKNLNITDNNKKEYNTKEYSVELDHTKLPNLTERQQKIKVKTVSKSSPDQNKTEKGTINSIYSDSEAILTLSTDDSPLIEKIGSTKEYALSESKHRSTIGTEIISNSININKDFSRNTENRDFGLISKQSTKSTELENVCHNISSNKPTGSKFKTVVATTKVNTSIHTDSNPKELSKILQVLDQSQQQIEKLKLKSKTSNIIKSDLNTVKMKTISVDQKANDPKSTVKNNVTISNFSSAIIELKSSESSEQESLALMKNQKETSPEEMLHKPVKVAQEKKSENCKSVPELSESKSIQSNDVANIKNPDKYIKVKSLKSLVATKKQTLNDADSHESPQLKYNIVGSGTSSTVSSETLQIKKGFSVPNKKIVTSTPKNEKSNRTRLLASSAFDTPISSYEQYSDNLFQENELASEVISLNTTKDKKVSSNPHQKLPSSNSEKTSGDTLINVENISTPKIVNTKYKDKKKSCNKNNLGSDKKFSPTHRKKLYCKSSKDTSTSTYAPRENETSPLDSSIDKNNLVVLPIPSAELINSSEISAENFFSTLELSSVRKVISDSERAILSDHKVKFKSKQQNSQNADTITLLTSQEKSNFTRRDSDVTLKDNMVPKDKSPEKYEKPMKTDVRQSKLNNLSRKDKIIRLKSPLKEKVKEEKIIAKKVLLTGKNLKQIENLAKQIKSNNLSNENKIVTQKSQMNEKIEKHHLNEEKGFQDSSGPKSETRFDTNVKPITRDNFRSAREVINMKSPIKANAHKQIDNKVREFNISSNDEEVSKSLSLKKNQEKKKDKNGTDVKPTQERNGDSVIKVIGIKSPSHHKNHEEKFIDDRIDFDVKSKDKEASKLLLVEKNLTNFTPELYKNSHQENNFTSVSKVLTIESAVKESTCLPPSTISDSSESSVTISKSNESLKSFKPIIVLKSQKKIIYDKINLDSIKSTQVTTNSLNKFAVTLSNIDQCANKNTDPTKSALTENSMRTVIPAGSKEIVTYIPIKEQKINNKDYVIVVKSPNTGNENKKDCVKEVTKYNPDEKAVQIAKTVPLIVQENKTKILKIIPIVNPSLNNGLSIKAHSPKKIIVFPESQKHPKPGLSTIDSTSKIEYIEKTSENIKAENDLINTNKKRKQKGNPKKSVTNVKDKLIKKGLSAKPTISSAEKKCNESLNNAMNVVHNESNSNKEAIVDIPYTANDVEETIPTFVVSSQVQNTSPKTAYLEDDSNGLKNCDDFTSSSCEKTGTDFIAEQHQPQEDLSEETCHLSVDSTFCLPESEEAIFEYDESNFEVANYVDIETTDSPRRVTSPPKVPSKIYNCVFCSLTCNDEISLLNHLTEAHAHDENLNKTLYRCSMCGCGFRSKEAMDQHVENKHSFCENEHDESTKDFEDCESSLHDCKKEKSTLVTLINFSQNEGTDAPIDSQNIAETPMMESRILKNEVSGNERRKKKKQSSKKRKCEVCNMKFSAGLGLFNHNRMYHRETHIFKCDSCKRQFSKYDKYQDHDCKPMTRLFCKRCNMHFTTEESMLKHKRLKHNMGTFKCDYCYKYFKSNANLIKHTKIKHLQETDNTDIPPPSTDIKAPYPNKQHSISPSSTIKPIFSKKQYSIYEDLKMIYKSIEKPLPHENADVIQRQTKLESNYVCNICDKQFNTKDELKSHKMIHKQRYYKCLKCSNKFVDKLMLLKHIKNVHKIVTNKIFKCDECNAVFKFEDKLKQHYKLKHNIQQTEAANQTENVDNSTQDIPKQMQSTAKTTSTNLKQKDEMYICKDCGAYLPSSESLQRHMQWEHMKSHKCGHCGEVLPTAEEFLRHLMSGHANEKIKEVLPESSFKWKTQLAYKHERQGD